MKLGIVLASLLAVCLVWVAQSANAGTIMIQDNGPIPDMVNVTGDQPNIVLIDVCIESCTAVGNNAIRLIAPANAVSVTSSLPNPFHLAEGPIGATSGTFPNSDGLNTNGINAGCITAATGCYLQFMSDGPGGSLGTDPSLTGSCTLGPDCVIETGGLQNVPGLITWKDAAGATLRTDTVLMASDPSEVPEPASILLFGSGLVMAGGFLRRRRQSVKPSV